MSQKNVDNDLRRQLGLKKSLQLLGQASSPMYQAASPLLKEAGTPSPFLPSVNISEQTKRNTPKGSPKTADPFLLRTPMNTPLRNSFKNNSKSETSELNQSTFFEKLKPFEGGEEMFKEFMELYCNHPHSADVFEVIEKYEELCRNNIKSLLEYIHKNDPSRRRLKRSVDLLNNLYQECYTWRLIGSLFRDRLVVEPQTNDVDMDEMPVVDSAKSERLIVDHLFNHESSTRQCQIIIDWLEKNMQDKLEDLLATQNLKFHSDSIYWEHTIHDLNQIKMGSKDVSLFSNLVTEADPDAPLRQNRSLSTIDQEDEEQLLLYMFRLIRAGKLEEAQKLCSDQGHFWRAATLDGWRLWHDPNFFEFDESSGDIQPAEGNPNRAFWKTNCWYMCEEKGCHMYEKAIYAALSGHLKQLLPACTSWEDLVWAHFKVLVDIRVEQEIRNYPRSGPEFADLPQSYWDQQTFYDLSPKGIMDQLKSNPSMEVKMQCSDKYRIIQTDIILNDIEGLLKHLNDNVNTDDIHFVRFMAHIVLFLQSSGIQANEEHCVNILKQYVKLLIDTKQNELVAAYTARLPAELQVEVYAKFLEGFQDGESRDQYLELAEEAGLDLKQITKQIVENIRMEQSELDGPERKEINNKKINSIDWLIYDPSQRAEAIKQANAIIREFLVCKDHMSAGAVFSKIPVDTIDIIHRQWRKRAGEKSLPIEYENAIREYLCIKAYLQAHDAFNEWFRHFHHAAPTKPISKANRTFKEQIEYEEHMKEYESDLHRWSHTLGLLCKSSSESIYNVLLFPGGWMKDQADNCSNSDDQRERQLVSIRQICIPYVTFLLHSVLQSNKQYKECLQLAEVIQSKKQKLYTVFQKHDLQKLLLLIKESAIALLDEGFDPFGFERRSIYSD